MPLSDISVLANWTHNTVREVTFEAIKQGFYPLGHISLRTWVSEIFGSNASVTIFEYIFGCQFNIWQQRMEKKIGELLQRGIN